MSSCSAFGPYYLKAGRPRYNLAIQETDKQQLFLNVIRLRYNEIPYFLEVANIYAAPAVEARAGVDTRLSPGSSPIFDLGTGIRYIEAPVIVYAPLGGEQFNRRLLKPIDFGTISLLQNAGWDLGRILRLCVQSINGVTNAESGAGPTPSLAPSFEVFNRTAATFERLDAGGSLTVGPPHVGGTKKTDKQNGPEEPPIRFGIKREVRQDPDVQQLFQDLKLDPEAPYYTVIPSVTGGGGDILAMVSRPLLGIMYYMSQSIEIPKDDVAGGIVTMTRTKDGQPFNWQQVVGDLIRIRSTLDEPDDPYVAVRHRGAWFYISSADIESKETFALLTILFTLQAGEKPTTPTAVTIPIG